MLGRIKARIRNMRIRNKFIFISIVVILLLVISIMVTISLTFYRTNVQNAADISAEESRIIHERLISLRNDVITCANMAVMDVNDVYGTTTGEDLEEVSFISIRNNLFTALDYDKRCFFDVDSILFIDTNLNICYTEGTEIDGKQIRDELLPYIPSSGLTSCYQLPMEHRLYFDEEPVLTLGKRVISITDGRIIGYLFLNIREETLSAIFRNDQEKEIATRFLLIDDKNRIVSTADKNLLLQTVSWEEQDFLESGENQRILKLSGQEYLAVKDDLQTYHWTLLNLVSLEDLYRSIRIATRMVVLLGILGMCIAIACTIYLSGLVTKPIVALTDSANHIQNGDFSVIYRSDTKDEVGYLARAFSVMVERIQELLNRIRKEEKEKRKYELALIQSQIKPHFLYNSLDLIYILCESNMAHDGAKVTKALADFYRNSLSSGREIITIREEIKNIESYLYIQHIRYEDVFDFSIDVSPAVQDFEILKLTLQPLVENAIYHGLKPAEKKGMICIEGKLEEQFILLSVADNGVGMEADMVSEMLSEEKGQKNHFGLASVLRRLKLYYGENTGMKILSRIGEGTRIELIIPKEMRENDTGIDRG